MIMPMTGIRIAWLVLAIAVAVLGSASAQWPVYEITSCEIGFDSLSSAVCLGTVHEYFGRQLFLVLAIPVALCIVPAVIPRPVVSWLVAGAMLSTAVWASPSHSAPQPRPWWRWWVVFRRRCLRWFSRRRIR
ncbi:hypothetical protein GCM10020255_024860 [Rhodococcus baikonurensis]